MTATTAGDYAAILRELAGELSALAERPAADVARELGGLLTRGVGIEARLTLARRDAFRVVVDQTGSQCKAALAAGISQGNLSRILRGIASPDTRERLGRAR